MRGANRQGRIRFILYNGNRLSLVNFYISIKPILGFKHEPSEEVFFFLYIIALIKIKRKEKKRIKVK
jgi:hypothetical protein